MSRYTNQTLMKVENIICGTIEPVARIEAQQRREAPYISEIETLSKELFSIVDARDFSTIERERIDHAFHLAMRLHAQQSPRSDGPYTHHILRVALRVARIHGANADSITSALLHDAVEDQPEALSLLMRKKDGERVDRVAHFIELFGEDVLNIVTLLTKKPPRLGHEKPEYRNFILGLVLDERALLIKVSDFLDNALGILEKPDNLRSRLAKKWGPVTPLLIMALRHLKHDHKLLNVSVRESLIVELEEAQRRLAIAKGESTK